LDSHSRRRRRNTSNAIVKKITMQNNTNSMPVLRLAGVKAARRAIRTQSMHTKLSRAMLSNWDNAYSGTTQVTFACSHK
jgi:hypothetical protein